MTKTKPKAKRRNLSDWLEEGVKTRVETKPGPQRTLLLKRECKRRSDACKAAKGAMEYLTLVMNKLEKVSEHAERDYAKIFQDETPYFDMVEACYKGYVTGVKELVGTDELQDALIAAGMGHYGKRKLADPPTRRRLLDALVREKGLSFLRAVWTRRDAVRSEPIDVYIQRSKIERGRREVEDKARTAQMNKTIELNKELLDMWRKMRSEERLEKGA